MLDSGTDQSPAALILTTREEPGNPEQHRQGNPIRYLHASPETMLLALVPKQGVDKDDVDLEAVEDIIFETLSGIDYGLHTATGIFCICRINPFSGEVAGASIPVYRILGGYMLQLNPEYLFTPQEMAVE